MPVSGLIQSPKSTGVSPCQNSPLITQHCLQNFQSPEKLPDIYYFNVMRYKNELWIPIYFGETLQNIWSHQLRYKSHALCCCFQNKILSMHLLAPSRPNSVFAVLTHWVIVEMSVQFFLREAACQCTSIIFNFALISKELLSFFPLVLFLALFLFNPKSDCANLNHKSKICSSNPCFCLQNMFWKVKCREMGLYLDFNQHGQCDYRVEVLSFFQFSCSPLFPILHQFPVLTCLSLDISPSLQTRINLPTLILYISQ